jgi:hypothetical protein
MPPKVHPADEAAARLIAGARRFEIALFRGQGSYARARAATLDEARAAAARLEAEVANGRPALIYALDAGGRSALVTPATFQATEMHAMQKTYSSKFNAQRAAERAGIAPDRIEVEKTPEGFVWREKPAAAAPAPAPAPRAKGRRPPRRSRPRSRSAGPDPLRGPRSASPRRASCRRRRISARRPTPGSATSSRLVELAGAGDIAGPARSRSTRSRPARRRWRAIAISA